MSAGVVCWVFLIKPCSSTISAFSTANNTRAMRLPMVLRTSQTWLDLTFRRKGIYFLRPFINFYDHDRCNS
jgi:hypothetical protein